uniref:Putative cnidarian restricted protein n=1 Tax=Clytia hemisphaerica TaxID=252671 RepID=A0A069DN43_9CNID
MKPFICFSFFAFATRFCASVGSFFASLSLPILSGNQTKNKIIYGIHEYGVKHEFTFTLIFNILTVCIYILVQLNIQSTSLFDGMHWFAHSSI